MRGERRNEEAKAQQRALARARKGTGGRGVQQTDVLADAIAHPFELAKMMDERFPLKRCVRIGRPNACVPPIPRDVLVADRRSTAAGDAITDTKVQPTNQVFPIVETIVQHFQIRETSRATKAHALFDECLLQDCLQEQCTIEVWARLKKRQKWYMRLSSETRPST